MAKRILFFILLIISIVYLPLWVSILWYLYAMVKYSWFGEGVLAFFLSDLLFGAHEPRFWDITYVSLIVSACVLVGWELLKKQLKFYS
jgi:hypothetical protein